MRNEEKTELQGHVKATVSELEEKVLTVSLTHGHSNQNSWWFHRILWDSYGNSMRFYGDYNWNLMGFDRGDIVTQCG